MKSFGHQRPVRNDAGEITGMVLSPVRVRTIEPLGRAYGTDHDKRLVLTAHPRDVIGLRPERTQRELLIEARDLYAHLIRLEANRALLQKARDRKIARAAQRESQRIARQKRQLFTRHD
jgi:hypothetical protein